MKTSTLVWVVAVIIIIAGGAWYFLATPAVAPTVTDTQTQTTTPLPTGDMAPVPSTPIASSSVNVSASTTLGQ